MTAHEFARVVAHLRQVDPKHAIRVLEQEKQVQWFEETMQEACLFYDVTRQGCLIYSARPLVCRLFGRVEWLPCPLARPLPLLPRGLEVARLYTAERRATFADWCMEHGLFDLRRLVMDGR
jgi:hypothetical protein